MPRKKYLINLSDQERQNLVELTHKGTLKARKFKRAMILLKADEGLSDPQIMAALGAALASRQVGRIGRGGYCLVRNGATDAQKNELKPWQQEMWCIPKAGGEYVACMEDVLDLYEQPFDPQRPLVCYDEWRRDLIGETRPRFPDQPGRRK